MEQQTSVDSVPPESLLELLGEHLPFSLPLLRRLQRTKLPVGKSSTGRVIIVSESNKDGSDSLQSKRFSATYLDVAGGPETQMWLYSTLEDKTNLTAEEIPVYEAQLNQLVGEAARLAKEYGKELVYPNQSVLLGTVHSSVRQILEKSGRVMPRKTGVYDKWLFKTDDVPSQNFQLPDGMKWSEVTADDCRTVISRTEIHRTVETLSRLPSLMIKLDNDTPICWAFLGNDASLTSLHCEDLYRRKGLAKALASKLFRDKTSQYGNDGWCSADVSPDNEGSRTVCRSLNGHPHWIVSWVLLDLRERV